MEIRCRSNTRWLATTFLVALCLMTTFFTRLVSVFAASANVRARVALQRVVDKTDADALGTVEVAKKGSRQTFSVTAKNLDGDDWGVLWGTSLGTNDPWHLIGALSKGISNETWKLSYESNDGFAPPQLPESDVEDMAGYVIIIGRPSEAESNVVEYVLWGEIPPLLKKSPSFKGKAVAQLPVIPPNPDARGKVKTAYKGSQGVSQLDFRFSRMAGGQTYYLFLEDPAGSVSFTNVAELVLSTSGKSASYRRDTKKGETLPLESATVEDLTGRLFQVRDAFEDIHLEGIVP